MASASNKKTFDTDVITVRRVFAKLYDNQNVPKDYVLTGVGDGTTYWAAPSTLGGAATINTISFDSTEIHPSTGARSLQLRDGGGIFFSTLLSSTTSTCRVDSKAFQTIDISGADRLYAFSNFLLTPTLQLAPLGYMSTSTFTNTNTIVFTTPAAPAMSIGNLLYQSLKVISSVAAPIDTTSNAGNAIFQGTSPSTVLTFAGVKDFLLTANTTTNTIFFNISSYTAAGFLGMSTFASTVKGGITSTISSYYVDRISFSTGTRAVSTVDGLNTSTYTASTIALSNDSQAVYNVKYADTLARATIVSLNSDFGRMNTGLSTLSSVKLPVYVLLSTNQSIFNLFSSPTTNSISTYTDFGSGSLFNFRVNMISTISTQLSTLSTSLNLKVVSMSNGLATGLSNVIISTQSTLSMLGSLGFLSSASLVSTVVNIGTSGYISTPALPSSFTFSNSPYLSSSTLRTALTSTVSTFTIFPYISNLTFFSTIVSTTAGFSNLLSNYTKTSDLQTYLPSTTQGIVDYASFQGYISTATLISSYVSTVSGLTNLYTSLSTLDGVLISSATSFGTTFVTSTQLVSTSKGLGNLYVSSLRFKQNYREMIPYEGTANGEQTMYTRDNVPETSYWTGTISTFRFNLTFLSSYMYDTSIVRLDFYPQIVFNPVNAGGLAFSNIWNVITCESNTALLNSRFSNIQQYCMSNNTMGNSSSNIYEPKLTFTFLGSDLLPRMPSSFYLTHILSNYVWEPGSETTFGISPYVTLGTSQMNSLFVSIYN